MTETALYRRYRPQHFDEVLGQEHVTNVLKNAVANNAFAHAYLFAGSRGTGKTSVARILADAIGVSENDRHEIDAASNRGIDDIRELREAVTSLPFESPYKIYIIDEVHMLTKEAFNALLKTLEEPPAHSVFILATTEADKLPETVVSRCQYFTFKQPGQRTLASALADIAKKEGVNLPQESAELIALLGEGSFRDAQSILQKVLTAARENTVTHEEVETVTGAPRSTRVNELIQHIQDKDLQGALKAVHDAVTHNTDMKAFLKLLLHKMRTVLLLKYAPDMEHELAQQFSEEDFAFLKDLSQKNDLAINSHVLNEMLSAYTAANRAYIPQLPLEIALTTLLDTEGE